MRDKIAHIISFVFHPLLMPTYLFTFIISFASALMQPLQKNSFTQVLAVIFIVTFIIPAISIGTLRLSNFITDFKLQNRNQRITPFIFITCFYGISAYMFYSKLNLNNLIFLIFASTTILLLTLTVITFFWKISIHGAGIGGTVGFLIALSYAYPISHFALLFSVIMIVAGLIIHARLSLNAHTPLQVYSGVALGFAMCFSSIYLFL